MLLTFAEIQFLASLGDHDPVLPILDMLEEPPRSLNDIADAGLASLIARELCREFLDDEGFVHHVDLDPEIAEIQEAIHNAVTSIRVTTVSAERTTFWLVLDGPRRVALTPVGAGVFGAVVVPHDADLRLQIGSLVNSALHDDPSAGVAISRGGAVDTMTFRTNDELGGPWATEAHRCAVIAHFVDVIFVAHHPSYGDFQGDPTA